MSTVEASLKWLEKTGDHLNAILVKETRQALKSRQFIFTFMLLVFASWIISVFAVAMMGDSINYGSSGQTLFNPYFFVLMIAITVIVPYGAFRSMLGEKDQNTFDSLRITSLSPWQIVWGKLLSAVLQDFIYYSAIAPFIAFTSLLEGFDFTAVAFVLACGFLISLCLSIFSLMLSTFAQQRHWQGILSIMLLVGLLSALGATTSSLMAFFSDSSVLQSLDFWLGFGVFLIISLSYCWLALQVTAAQLTFESGNRSSGIRLISTVQFAVIGSVMTGFCVWYPTAFDEGLFLMTTTLLTIHLIFLGLITVTEQEFLSRRIRKSLPERTLYRFLFSPFMPGGARGMVYVLMNLLLLFGLQFLAITSLAATSSGHINYEDIAVVLAGISLYAIIYLGFASAMGRMLHRISGEFKPNHVRVLTFIVFALGCILPLIASALELVEWRSYSILYITNPFSTIDELADGHSWTGPILLLLGGTATVAILLNFRAMFRGIREVVILPAAQTNTPVAVNPFQVPVESSPPATTEG